MSSMARPKGGSDWFDPIASVSPDVCEPCPVVYVEGVMPGTKSEREICG